MNKKKDYKKIIIGTLYLIIPTLMIILVMSDFGIIFWFRLFLGFRADRLLLYLLTIVGIIVFFKLKCHQNMFWTLVTGIALSPVFILFIPHGYWVDWGIKIFYWGAISIMYVLPMVALSLITKRIWNEDIMKKVSNIILIVIAGICLLLSAIFIVRYFNIPSLSQDRIERIFYEEQSSLETIVDYLKDFEYEEIRLRANSWDGTQSSARNFYSIYDEEIFNEIDRLFSQGFLVIGRYDNAIYFLRWVSHRDRGRGVAFTIDGYPPNTIRGITHYEPLSIDGWWYFEDDNRLID